MCSTELLFFFGTCAFSLALGRLVFPFSFLARNCSLLRILCLFLSPLGLVFEVGLGVDSVEDIKGLSTGVGFRCEFTCWSRYLIGIISVKKFVGQSHVNVGELSGE